MSDSFFRSAKMVYCQIFFPKGMAYDCMVELGELGVVQIKDINAITTNSKKIFYKQLLKCDVLEDKLHFIKKEIMERHFKIVADGTDYPAPQENEFENLESEVNQLEVELHLIKKTRENLIKEYDNCKEEFEVFQKSQDFLSKMDGEKDGEYDIESSEKIRTLIGVIPASKSYAFEVMLWRISRGNIIINIEDFSTDNDLSSHLNYNSRYFSICCHSDEIYQKVLKVCNGFKATLYDIPENPEIRQEKKDKLAQELAYIKDVLNLTELQASVIISNAREQYMRLYIQVLKMKATFFNLNNCDSSTTEFYYIAEAWIPEEELNNVNYALKNGSDKGGYNIQPAVVKQTSTDIPPTYHPVNKFTAAFQNMIDAYGIATYQEINPAPYIIITFPFLFAVMFGDVGHGLIMALAALWMILYEKKLAYMFPSEIFQLIFAGRYILLLMGIFSMYTGLIYNDMFSKPLNLFGSHWFINRFTWQDWVTVNETHMLDPATFDYLGHPYVFGTDPVWLLSENEIPFMNNFKMKVSIILGILHMKLGLYLNFKNRYYNKNYMVILCEWIPMVLFLTCMFVYLCLLIFIKWFTYYANDDDTAINYSERCAPSILITYINMVLLKPTVVPILCDQEMYAGQQIVEKILLLVSVICVPWLLLAKPITIYIKRRKSIGATRQLYSLRDNSLLSSIILIPPTDSHETMSDVFIHQIIQTIEYILGCVSHTASYLRLWALSLAHNQLSLVLWNMVLTKGLSFKNTIVSSVANILVFYGWALLTICILVLMEGLSAFLHTLRLHWVEFQSKFYDGMGIAFQPFRFQSFIKNYAESKSNK